MPKIRTLGKPTPRTLEHALHRALLPMIRQVRATLPKIKTAADARALGRALKRKWSDKAIRAIVLVHGRKAERVGSMPWGVLTPRTDARRREYDGDKLLEQWSRKAAKRITSVRDEVAEALRRDVVAALVAGTDPSVLTDRWVAQGIPVLRGTLEGRMKVIAQNQINTLHAQVQSERARAVGVTEFRWRTQGDNRVREAHRVLEGRRFTYAEPPSEGLPGTPINCRCWAESIVPDALVAELGLTAAFDT